MKTTKLYSYDKVHNKTVQTVQEYTCTVPGSKRGVFVCLFWYSGWYSYDKVHNKTVQTVQGYTCTVPGSNRGVFVCVLVTMPPYNYKKMTKYLHNMKTTLIKVAAALYA